MWPPKGGGDRSPPRFPAAAAAGVQMTNTSPPSTKPFAFHRYRRTSYPHRKGMASRAQGDPTLAPVRWRMRLFPPVERVRGSPCSLLLWLFAIPSVVDVAVAGGFASCVSVFVSYTRAEKHQTPSPVTLLGVTTFIDGVGQEALRMRGRDFWRVLPIASKLPPPCPPLFSVFTSYGE